MSTPTVPSSTEPPAAPRWRSALVIGLGASGLAAARLLLDLGVGVRGYDRRGELDHLPGDLETLLGTPAPPADAFDGVDLVVLSPGVAPLPVRALATAHAPDADILGELSLGLRLLEDLGRSPRIVLVTGTNGKSTVTALTGHLLQSAGRDAFTGGNLGTPLCTLVRECRAGTRAWPDDLVLECSSFQLETYTPVPTAVAMVLNVTPDHLDRYTSLEEYAATKARVFSGLTSNDLALVDAEDPWSSRIAPTHGPRVARVGEVGKGHVEGEGSGRALVVGDDPPYPRAPLRLPGRHNSKNALFALLTARHLGATPEQCRRGLASFEGLPHRMVLVRELGGVRYYDDSKATNVASALASLGGLDEPFVLIAGGRAKGDDLTPLKELIARRAQGVVAIGEAAPHFAALGTDARVPTATAATMEDAVKTARSMARPGDAVVLAPACASFDQYRSYAHRGQVFAAAVDKLG